MTDVFPTLDGHEPSWANIACTIKGASTPFLKTDGITALNCSVAVDIGVVTVGGRPVATTTGEEKPESSITFYESWYDAVAYQLSESAPKRGDQYLISLVHFNIEVQFEMPGSDRLYTRRVYGARMAGWTDSRAQGADANTIEVPLSVKQIVKVVNGREIAMI